jgi:formate dehydrogenase maturation protein FdhE
MIETYLTQSAQITRKTGQDAYSKPTYAAAESFNCRVDEKIKLIKNAQGDMVQVDATMFVASDFDIDNDDKIVYSGRDYKVYQTSLKSFINDNSHKEVLLKAV